MRLIYLSLLGIILLASSPLLAKDQNLDLIKIIDLEKLKKRYFEQSPFDLGEDNPLYREILNELNDQYQRIGEDQTDQIISKLGPFNNVGFGYSKNFVDFDFKVNRIVAPNLFDERWVVTDEISIIIDAFAFLSNLKEDEIISITDAKIGLFAGLSFKRTYRYTHFSDSYIEGLTGHFDKLFLSFLKFRNRGYLELEPYEILQKEDYLGAKAGGVATIPIYGQPGVAQISASIGALVKFNRLANITIQAVGREDGEKSSEDERLRISYEKTKSLEVGVSASIQAEFLEFLRVTLMSFDFSYQYSDMHKTYLSLSESDIEEVYFNDKIARAIDNILWMRSPDIKTLAPYAVAHERRITQDIHSKYIFLLFGGRRDQKTQHIQLYKDGLLSTFFKHNYEKVHFKQNFFSRVLKILFKSLIKADRFVTNDVIKYKRFSMEYKSEENLIHKKEDLNIQDDYKLSLNFNVEYFAHKTKGLLPSLYKKHAIRLINDYSALDSEVAKMLEREKLKGPLTFKSHMQVGKEGVNYFNDLSLYQIYKRIRQTCDNKSNNFWEELRSALTLCRFRLYTKYDLYYKELVHHDFSAATAQVCSTPEDQKKKWSSRKQRLMKKKCMELISKKSKADQRLELPLWRLKSFLQEMHGDSRHKRNVLRFFGGENVFFYGSLEAVQGDNIPFRAYFHDGKFRDLGLVDSHMRSEGLVVPITIY